jgi:hypothetical protein
MEIALRKFRAALSNAIVERAQTIAEERDAVKD